jgi:biopolymer transport protein ExbD
LQQLSSTHLSVTRGLPVNLPTAATSQRDLREHLNLTLTQDGAIFLNKEPIALQDLGPRVRTALASEPALMVIINPDGEVRHHAVVEVMDELRLAGVARLATAVRPDRKARP